ncbi:hypothetical protein ATPR_0431 [Acetobacter tropicalis NBRC 101654]|uniref:Uncharacterized protein n=1 Tax=Acetobacter tropicalis NBRC 101654 TaxID=749388 RepID=F7VAN2_9PROT|nr:hypothetical protein ATPR_0431 [Acetobacter tropicalis NBRC 101654]
MDQVAEAVLLGAAIVWVGNKDHENRNRSGKHWQYWLLHC